jgi:mannose-1-phosphate guanylyltransferase/mannose-6-phosphate isomerase
MKSYFVVIMAGGTGKRLGPISSQAMPKQFHALISDRTMLQETFERVSAIARQDHIFVSTTEDYTEIVCDQLSTISPERIFVEPCPRDTLPAIAFVAAEIYKRDPNAIIVTTPSDHAIKYKADFTRAVQIAIDVVERYPERIGMLGIRPEGPSTALGYIRRGNEIPMFRDAVFEVDAFREKPDQKTAQKYCRDGEHYWNGGYFIFRASTLCDLVKEHAPNVFDILMELREISDHERRKELFRSLKKEPIDRGIIEKLSENERFVVPVNLGWSDVGTWNTLHEYSPKDENGNVCRGDVKPIDSRDNLLFATTSKIVTYGVHNLIVVQVDGTIAIYDRKRADEIKEIIAHL